MGINADIAYADSTRDYWKNILGEMQAGNWDQFSAIDRAPLVRPTNDGTIYSVLGGQLGGLPLTEMDHQRIREAAAEYEEGGGGGNALLNPDATKEILQALQVTLPNVNQTGWWGDPNALSRVTAGGNDIMSTVGYDAGVRTGGGDKFYSQDTWESPAQYGFTLDHYGNVYKGGDQTRMDWLRQRDAMLPEDALGAGEWNQSLSPMTDQEFQQAQYEKAQGRYTMANDLFDTYTERKANQNSNFFSSNFGKAAALAAAALTAGWAAPAVGITGAGAAAAGGAVAGGALGAPTGNILGGALTGGALAGLGAYGLDQIGGAEGLLGGMGDYIPSGISDLFSNSDGMIPFGDKTLQAIGEGITPTFEGAGIAANSAFLPNASLGGIAPALSGLSATNGLLPASDFSFVSTLGNSVPYSPMPGTHASGYNLNLPTGTADQITPYFEGAGIGTPEPGVDYGELAKQGLKLLGGAEAPVQGGGVATSTTAPFRGGQFNPTAQQARFQGAQLNPLLRRF